jgi:hypothetical protein
MKADELWPAFSRPFQITMTYVPPETRRVVAKLPDVSSFRGIFYHALSNVHASAPVEALH